MTTLPAFDSKTYRDWKGWHREQFGDLTDEQTRYFEAELQRAGVLTSIDSVLEIGFGNGAFFGFCRVKGWDCAGTEADPELVSRAGEAGMDARLAGKRLVDQFAGRRFDLVVAFDVLEHIETEDLALLLRDIRELLVPGGTLLARFPSGDSPFSGRMYHGDMTHRTLIGSGKIAQLARGAGLDLVSTRGAALPLRGVGVRRVLRRIPVILARTLIQRVIRLVYHDNVAGVIDPNMVAVLRRTG